MIDAGRKLETAVFLHWRRHREDLAYLSGEREIDLIVNGERPEALINVALSITQPTAWEREIAALEWAAAKAPPTSRKSAHRDGSAEVYIGPNGGQRVCAYDCRPKAQYLAQTPIPAYF